MSRLLSRMISRCSLLLILIITIAAVIGLIRLDLLAEMARQHLHLPILWNTVETWQWYALWTLLALSLSIGVIGLVFLHRAFAKIADGELFNLTNSVNIRRFSLLLLAQVIAKPLTLAAASVLLSANHPAGQKVLSIAFGSHDLMTLAVAMILWVVSDLLIVGTRLQSENQQFV